MDDLKLKLDKTREHFIPERANSLGSYSEREYYHASAYCIICHSEVEHYIESIIRSKIQRNMDMLKNGSGNYVSGMHALCWYVFNCATDDGSISLRKLKEKYEDIFKPPTEEVLNECQFVINKAIANNHGIQQKTLNSF